MLKTVMLGIDAPPNKVVASIKDLRPFNNWNPFAMLAWRT